jgi:hypothetical protein
MVLNGVLKVGAPIQSCHVDARILKPSMLTPVRLFCRQHGWTAWQERHTRAADRDVTSSVSTGATTSRR